MSRSKRITELAEICVELLTQTTYQIERWITLSRPVSAVLNQLDNSKNARDTELPCQDGGGPHCTNPTRGMLIAVENRVGAVGSPTPKITLL